MRHRKNGQPVISSGQHIKKLEGRLRHLRERIANRTAQGQLVLFDWQEVHALEYALSAMNHYRRCPHNPKATAAGPNPSIAVSTSPSAR
jgi:hypothetical protein